MGGLNLVKLALDMKTERRVALKFMGAKVSTPTLTLALNPLIIALTSRGRECKRS